MNTIQSPSGNSWQRPPKTIEEHDKVYHPNGFDPDHGTCSFRERIAKLDSLDKIYAVSDIHMSGIDDVDDTSHGTIMIAGDFMEKAKHHSDFKSAGEWFENTFKPWCEKHKDQKIVLIGGNTDKWLYENRDKITWPPNVTYLDDSAAEVNGMKVYGTSWCPKNLNGAWEVDPDELEERYSEIPEGLDVLITHAPPRIEGSDIDYDTTFKEHFGSPELTKAILEKKPKLVLCGHVHSGSHKPIRLGDSIVMNVSRVDDDRYEKSWHGKSIGLDKMADELGFMVDMDDEGKISLGKKGNIPEDIRELKESLLSAAKTINGHIDKGKPVDDEMVEKAEKAIEDYGSKLKTFDHPKRKMLEAAIEQFRKSRLSGWNERMSRIGKLYDDDYPVRSFTSVYPDMFNESRSYDLFPWEEALGDFLDDYNHASGKPHKPQHHKTWPMRVGGFGSGHGKHVSGSSNYASTKKHLSTSDILLGWKRKKESLLGGSGGHMHVSTTKANKLFGYLKGGNK